MGAYLVKSCVQKNRWCILQEIASTTTQLTQKRKDTHTMPKDNVVDFKKSEPFVDDPITDVLRTGAKKLLAEALEAEISGLETIDNLSNIHNLFQRKYHIDGPL